MIISKITDWVLAKVSAKNSAAKRSRFIQKYIFICQTHGMGDCFREEVAVKQYQESVNKQSIIFIV